MCLYTDSLNNGVFLSLILLLINLILKSKTFLSPIDFDTANHLYFAFLKKKKIPFLSSYNPGIKFLLPRIYSACNLFIGNRPYRFRIINTIASSILIILWVLTDPAIDETEIPFYFIGVLLINSLWINFQTSASEFHESIILILIFTIPGLLRFEIVWIGQILLLMILIGGFKFINILYLPAIIAFQYKNIPTHYILITAGSTISVLYTYTCIKNKFKETKTYSNTRKFLNPKSLLFLKHTPYFWGSVFLLGICNLLFTSWEWAFVQVTVWLIFFIQKSYISYFFYPLVALGFCIAFKNDLFVGIHPLLGYAVLIIFFFSHTVRKILILSPRIMDIQYRNLFSTGWSQFLDSRDRQIEWLKNNISPEKNVYLWGSNVALLLLSGLTHCPDTFYNHNHLIYWTDIEDKNNYAKNYILEKKPTYIIESEVMENMKFPADEFKKIYNCIVSIDHMSVYQLLEKI